MAGDFLTEIPLSSPRSSRATSALSGHSDGSDCSKRSGLERASAAHPENGGEIVRWLILRTRAAQAVGNIDRGARHWPQFHFPMKQKLQRSAELAADCEREGPLSREIVGVMNVVSLILCKQIKFLIGSCAFMVHGNNGLNGLSDDLDRISYGLLLAQLIF
jgi:hypothetical protein